MCVCVYVCVYIKCPERLLENKSVWVGTCSEWELN